MTEKKDAAVVEVVPFHGHETLAAALAAFQAELPTITKGNRASVETKAGGTYSYEYADLSDISPVVLPLLGRQGLSWSCRPTMQGDNFVLVYSLTHSSGDSIMGDYPLPDPDVNTPQQIGSAITYARRYALCSVTGVAPGGDDDDAKVTADVPAGKSRAKRAPANPPQKPVVGPEVASQDWVKQATEATTLEALKAVCVAVEKAGELGLPVNKGEKPVGDFLRDLWASRSAAAEKGEAWANPEPEPSEWGAPGERLGVLDESIGGESK